MKPIIFIALEASGDLIGAKLISALGTGPFYGVGGPKMREAGLQAWEPMEKFQAIGPVEVLKKLPQIFKLVALLEKKIAECNPAAIIFVDSPSFSLRFAKRWKGKIPNVQIVAPSVWAWGKEKRLKAIQESIDLLFPLFRFEENLFPVETHWCGHPLYTKAFSLPSVPKSKKPLLALFPGSRPGEVKKHISFMLKTAEELQQKIPTLQVAVSVSETLPDRVKKLIYTECTNLPFVSCVPGSDRYRLMEESWAALAKCGTVTLELFLKKVPTIVCYKVSKIERFWAKHVLKIETPFFALPNILAGKEVVKECIAQEPSSSDLASLLIPFLTGQHKSVDEQALHLVDNQLFSSAHAEEIIAQHIRSRFL